MPKYIIPYLSLKVNNFVKFLRLEVQGKIPLQNRLSLKIRSLLPKAVCDSTARRRAFPCRLR